MTRYGKDIKLSFEVLDESNCHYTENFLCDNPSIDDYFRYKALEDKTAVTYLFIDTEYDTLAACVTVVCSAIFNEEDYEQFSTILSAMEIKYFATDVKYQHLQYFDYDVKLSLSDVLFDYMIDTLRDISCHIIGAAKIVLYSVSRAVSFYKKHDFKKFGDTMYGDQGFYLDGCEPMYMDLNS